MDFVIRRARPADDDRVSTIFREASLSNEGDRPLLAADREMDLEFGHGYRMHLAGGG